MRPLKQLIEEKPATVTVTPDDTVFAALTLLAQFDIGALLVLAGVTLCALTPPALVPVQEGQFKP